MGYYEPTEDRYETGYERGWEQAKDWWVPRRDDEIKLIIKELQLQNRNDKNVTSVLDKLILRIEGKENKKMKVTVYTTDNCVQCEMTKKQFKNLDIRYEEVSLNSVPEKLEEFKAQGYLAAPIVTTDVKIWSGFRIDKIRSLADYLKSQER